MARRNTTPVVGRRAEAAATDPGPGLDPVLAAGVAASNTLTLRWLRRMTEPSSFVVSGAGAWMMLVALARGASGQARADLESAVGISGDDAAELLRTLVETVQATDGVSAVMGIWTTPLADVLNDYAEAVAMVRVEPIPADRSELDMWVHNETGGVLERFPVTLTDDIVMAMASALVAQADWIRPFTGGSGRWRGREQPIGWLHRASDDLSEAAILRSGSVDVGRVVCATVAGFDVHLLTADPSSSPTDVLTVGLEALGGHDVDLVDGQALDEGGRAGGLTVRRTEDVKPMVRLSLPAFECTSTWELTNPSGLRVPRGQ